MATLLGEALGAAAPPTLDALQFPYRPSDAWLGLRFPEQAPNGDPFALVEDKLLYSATFAAGAEVDPTQPALTYSGLLLDEWVEVIPTEQTDSGLYLSAKPGIPQAIAELKRLGLDRPLNDSRAKH